MNLVIPVRDNIELRLLKSEDAEALFNEVSSNKEYLREWLAWVDEDKMVEDTKKYIEASLKRFEEKEGIDFQIWEGDRMIGGIGMYPIDNVHKKTSLGYWLGEDSQGKGIMTDCLKKVIEYAFKDLKLNRIQITCGVGNKKSLALPQRLGFTFEGVLRQSEWLSDHFSDSEVYSLLSSEWRSET